jgi:hypothetical protein
VETSNDSEKQTSDKKGRPVTENDLEDKSNKRVCGHPDISPTVAEESQDIGKKQIGKNYAKEQMSTGLEKQQPIKRTNIFDQFEFDDVEIVRSQPPPPSKQTEEKRRSSIDLFGFDEIEDVRSSSATHQQPTDSICLHKGKSFGFDTETEGDQSPCTDRNWQNKETLTVSSKGDREKEDDQSPRTDRNWQIKEALTVSPEGDGPSCAEVGRKGEHVNRSDDDDDDSVNYRFEVEVDLTQDGPLQRPSSKQIVADKQEHPSVSERNHDTEVEKESGVHQVPVHASPDSTDVREDSRRSSSSTNNLENGRQKPFLAELCATHFQEGSDDEEDATYYRFDVDTPSATPAQLSAIDQRTSSFKKDSSVGAAVQKSSLRNPSAKHTPGPISRKKLLFKEPENTTKKVGQRNRSKSWSTCAAATNSDEDLAYPIELSDADDDGLAREKNTEFSRSRKLQYAEMIADKDSTCAPKNKNRLSKSNKESSPNSSDQHDEDAEASHNLRKRQPVSYKEPSVDDLDLDDSMLPARKNDSVSKSTVSNSKYVITHHEHRLSEKDKQYVHKTFTMCFSSRQEENSHKLANSSDPYDFEEACQDSPVLLVSASLTKTPTSSRTYASSKSKSASTSKVQGKPALEQDSLSCTNSTLAVVKDKDIRKEKEARGAKSLVKRNNTPPISWNSEEHSSDAEGEDSQENDGEDSQENEDGKEYSLSWNKNQNDSRTDTSTHLQSSRKQNPKTSSKKSFGTSVSSLKTVADLSPIQFISPDPHNLPGLSDNSSGKATPPHILFYSQVCLLWILVQYSFPL